MSLIFSSWLANLNCSDVDRLKVVTDSAIDVSVNKTITIMIVINTALNLVLLDACFVLVGFTPLVAL